MSFRNILVLLLLAVLSLNGCSMAKIESLRKTRNIVIDGNDKDWVDAKYYVEDKNMVIGVMNDDEFLYVCFYPTTQEQTQMILTRGCTLWLNNDAKRKKDYGINFPLGIQFGKPQRPKENFNELSAGKNDSFDPKMTKNLLNKIPRELKIIGLEKNKINHFQFSELKNMELAIDCYKSLFAYEMKIPLQKSEESSFSVNAEPGSEIALGIEVPELDLDEKKSDMQRPEGDMSGGRGGMSGGDRGGGMNASNSTSNSGFDLWLKIKLVL